MIRRGKTYVRRVSLNVTHMQLVGEEEPHPDDLYGIPDSMFHNRKLSRVTDTPHGPAQGVYVNVRESTPPHTSMIEDLDDLHHEGSDGATHVTDSLIATQRLPSQTQPDRGMDRMKLSSPWATRLAKKTTSKGYVSRGSINGDIVDCQCKYGREEGEMVSS